MLKSTPKIWPSCKGLMSSTLGAHMLRSVLARGGARANHGCALDTTYIQMSKHFVYLTAIVDVANHRVLAHTVATTL